MKKLPLVALPLLLGTLLLQGCPAIKPIIKTANNLAYDLCVAEHALDGERMALSAEDIGKMFCATEEALKPFLDAILSAKAKLHAPTDLSVTMVPPPPPVCPSVTCLAVKPIVSAAPAPSASAPAPVISAEPKLIAPMKKAAAK